MDVYRRAQRRERELRFLEQVRLNRAAWSGAPRIIDLANPHAKRFVLGLSCETGKGTCEGLEAL